MKTEARQGKRSGADYRGRTSEAAHKCLLLNRGRVPLCAQGFSSYHPLPVVKYLSRHKVAVVHRLDKRLVSPKGGSEQFHTHRQSNKHAQTVKLTQSDSLTDTESEEREGVEVNDPLPVPTPVQAPKRVRRYFFYFFFAKRLTRAKNACYNISVLRDRR